MVSDQYDTTVVWMRNIFAPSDFDGFEFIVSTMTYSYYISIKRRHVRKKCLDAVVFFFFLSTGVRVLRQANFNISPSYYQLKQPLTETISQYTFWTKIQFNRTPIEHECTLFRQDNRDYIKSNLTPPPPPSHQMYAPVECPENYGFRETYGNVRLEMFTDHSAFTY